MQLTEEYNGLSGIKYIFEYSDCDDFSVLDMSKCQQTYGVCFLEGGEEFVIVHNGKKDTWGLVGGTVEPGETLEETFVREVQEESNMQVLKMKPVGYQKVIDTTDGSFVYQLRYVAIVKSLGEFMGDPAGSVDKIAFAHKENYKEYFDWRSIGERIIEKAYELKNTL